VNFPIQTSPSVIGTCSHEDKILDLFGQVGLTPLRELQMKGEHQGIINVIE
jgi:hypothetical protein